MLLTNIPALRRNDRIASAALVEALLELGMGFMVDHTRAEIRPIT